MNNEQVKESTVKIAGIMFLLCFLVPMVNWSFNLSKLIDPGDATATADNILAGQIQFRFGLVIELFMAAGLLVLASSLYTILKNISRNLALIALTWKVVEAALVGVMVLVSFISLILLTGTAEIPGFDGNQLKVIAGILLQQHMALYAVLMVFLGIDMPIFFYLFYKSEYIPKWLSLFGIFSFICILIHSLLYILFPDAGASPVVQGLLYTPSALLEIVLGIWLLTNGLNNPESMDQPAAAGEL